MFRGKEREGNQSMSFREQATCLTIVFYCIVKTFSQKQLGEKGFYLAYVSISQSIIQRSQGKNSRRKPGTWRQELKQSPWRCKTS